jgi:hypothetical protein
MFPSRQTATFTRSTVGAQVKLNSSPIFYDKLESAELFNRNVTGVRAAQHLDELTTQNEKLGDARPVTD